MLLCKPNKSAHIQNAKASGKTKIAYLFREIFCFANNRLLLVDYTPG
jgi:hypothetical protein